MTNFLLKLGVTRLSIGHDAKGKAMSGETDLIKLYSARILELAADIPHHGRLAAPQVSVKRRAPLCGSTVTVDLSCDAGRVSDYAAEVKACALGQAAASVVGRNIIGCDLAQVTAARDTLKEMLKSDGPAPSTPFDGLEVLRPARDYKNRHASILLTLEAAVEAMEEVRAQTACT
jgi:NifU-like protein involved in Fe-S cluster formation